VTLLPEGGERTIVTVGERLEPRGADALPWEVLEQVEGVYFTAGDVAALEHARRAPIVVASPRGRRALERGPEIDALVYSGGDSDEVEWARRLDGKARVLVETRGQEGGEWSGASGGSWSPVAPDGPIKDSYGAGDSFAAAFTFALAGGAAVAEAAALGARAGARCLTRVGAP
jgi:ribokinase